MKYLCCCTALICAISAVFLFYNIGNIFFCKSKFFVKRAQVKMEKKDTIKKYLTAKYLWLRQMGVTYMLGRDISVYSFIVFRLISGIISCIAALRFISDFRTIQMYIAIIIITYIGSLLPVMFLKLSNRMDNSLMLEDIKLIYDTLKIQSRSGVYITDILTECYLIVRTPRLKDALRELSNEIFTKHDLQRGLTVFNSKFQNVYIDMLVMTIEQSIQSGQSVQMFYDIAQQIGEVEQALFKKEKRKAENKMLAYELAVYFAILMIVVYAMFSQLLKAFSF